MPERQRVVVIGLGRFGAAVAEGLTEAGHDVLGIDFDAPVVQRMADRLSHVVQADALDEQALAGLGLSSFDGGVIAITRHLEASILATLLLRRLGVKRVIAKAQNDLHGEILTRLGADTVVYPERDSGWRVARTWGARNVTDAMEVVPGYMLERLPTPVELVGKAVGELADPERGTNLLLLGRGSRVLVQPSSREVLQRGDVLIVGGDPRRIEAFFTSLERRD